MNTSNNNDDMSTLLSDQQSFTSHHLMSSHESLQEIPLPAPRIQYETSSLHQSCCSMQLPCSFTTGFSIAAKPELISSPPPAMASDLVISTDDRHQGKELNPQTEKKRKNNMKREGEDEFEKQSNKRYRKRQKKVAEAATSTGYVHVRARRGEATDSHSLAERVRRRKISARMKLLQSLVPGCDQLTGKALILDEIIKYVQALQTQVQYLADKLASVNPMLNKDLGPNFIDPADKLPVNENDNNILQSSMDISKIQGSANQFGLDDLCSLW